MSRQLTLKLAVAGASTALAAGAAWTVVRAWPRTAHAAPTVRVVDITQTIYRTLQQRRTSSPRPPSPGDPRPLHVEELDEATARVFIPALRVVRSDLRFEPRVLTIRIGPRTYEFPFAEAPGGGWSYSCDSRGLRSEREVPAAKAGLRVLITGDSHTDGVCADADTFARVCEREWSACHPERLLETLNAGMGGYQPYNYLGVIDVFADLAPDVFVVTVYGGNDFSGIMPLQRYFERRGSMRAPDIDLEKVAQQHPEVLGATAQEMNQAVFFRCNQDDVVECIDTLQALSLEIERKCRALGARALFVYLPPPFAVQRHFFAEELERARRYVRMSDAELSVSDRIADPWLEFLAQRGLAALDLRPHFRAAREPWYWRADHHLNVAGHRAVGQQIALALDALLR